MKPKFEVGTVIVVPKARTRRYTLRALGSPGVIANVFYSKRTERYVYEIQFTESPEFEFIREDDLEPRAVAPVGAKKND